MLLFSKKVFHTPSLLENSICTKTVVYLFFFFVGLLKHLFQRPTEDTTERKTRHHKRFISGKTGRYTVNWCNICTCKTLDTKETRASLYLNKYCIYLQVAKSVFICWICRLCAIHTKTQLKQTVKAG